MLFGHPTLEMLSRKMMQFGCDDYIVTPAKAGEIQQIFGAPARLTEPRPPRAREPRRLPSRVPPGRASARSRGGRDAGRAAAAPARRGGGGGAAIHAQLARGWAWRSARAGGEPPAAPDGAVVSRSPCASHGDNAGALFLTLAADDDHGAAATSCRRWPAWWASWSDSRTVTTGCSSWRSPTS